jgi:hypothetical protein
VSTLLTNRRVSVLQDWVTELPLREQGTLLTSVRGCDLTPKYPLDSQERASDMERLLKEDGEACSAIEVVP